ncbi:MAG: competence/damage-inducible protein A [Synergistetes bacterium]|nr:competence/damage-inducible protein A [Synergistota bacterium]
MRAVVLSTGDEVLLGEISESNGGFISRALVEVGIDVFARFIVEDDREKLIDIMKIALDNADMLIITGGLGPTDDDLTREAVASLLGVKLELREEARKWIDDFFKRLGRDVPPEAEKQLLFPEGAEIIPNELGTACGFFIERGGKVIAALSGVPWEAERMFNRYLLPRLSRGREIFLKRLHIIGLRETQAFRILKSLDLGDRVKVGICASLGSITIYLRGNEEYVSRAADLIREAFGEFLYGEDGKSLEEVVAELCWRAGTTISIAESCSGGLLGHRLTNVPGSSKYFKCGVVSYSNLSKAKLLGVPMKLIEQKGAVSAEVAEKMAEGVRTLGDSDIGIGITGIAGPTGGRPGKPVGTVYIALASEANTHIERNQFSGTREVIKYRTTQRALDLIRRFLLEVDPFGSEGNN